MTGVSEKKLQKVLRKCYCVSGPIKIVYCSDTFA